MERVARKMILLLGIAAGISRSEPPVPNTQYGVPDNFGGSHTGHGLDSGVTNSYGAPLNGGGHDSHQDYVDSQPKSYEFGYAVKDAVSGNDFGRRETSDGETVRGEYRVQLPDGRTQIVTYTADWRTGFHADVRYEGVASYPEQYNNNNNNNHNSHNNGNGYNDLNTNSGFNIGGYNGGSNDHGLGGNNYHVGSTGNYNSGYNSNNNNNYGTSGQNYNGNSNNNNNNYNGGNSLDGSTGYNYPGYSSNTYDSKAPIPSYGTPAYH